MAKIKTMISEESTTSNDNIITRGISLYDALPNGVNTYDISGSTVYSTTYGYSSASDVAALCRNLLSGEENFSSSTSPNLVSVESWLSSGCSIIESKMLSNGYKIPIGGDTILFGWLRDINTLYAASRAELSRLNITLNTGERTRGQLFEERFWKQLEDLGNMDLTTVGAAKSDNTISSMTMFVGGTSVTQKANSTGNSDRVSPRFSKGMFNMPGTIEPKEE